MAPPGPVSCSPSSNAQPPGAGGTPCPAPFFPTKPLSLGPSLLMPRQESPEIPLLRPTPPPAAGAPRSNDVHIEQHVPLSGEPLRRSQARARLPPHNPSLPSSPTYINHHSIISNRISSDRGSGARGVLQRHGRGLLARDPPGGCRAARPAGDARRGWMIWKGQPHAQHLHAHKGEYLSQMSESIQRQIVASEGCTMRAGERRRPPCKESAGGVPSGVNVRPLCPPPCPCVRAGGQAQEPPPDARLCHHKGPFPLPLRATRPVMACLPSSPLACGPAASLKHTAPLPPALHSIRLLPLLLPPSLPPRAAPSTSGRAPTRSRSAPSTRA